MYLVIRVLVHVDTRKTAGKNMPPWCYWLSNTPQGTLKLSSIDALQILDSLTFLDNNYRLFCDETEVIMPVNMLMFWPLTTQYLLRYYMSTQYSCVGPLPILELTLQFDLSYIPVKFYYCIFTRFNLTWLDFQTCGRGECNTCSFLCLCLYCTPETNDDLLLLCDLGPHPRFISLQLHQIENLKPPIHLLVHTAVSAGHNIEPPLTLYSYQLIQFNILIHDNFVNFLRMILFPSEALNIHPTIAKGLRRDLNITNNIGYINVRCIAELLYYQKYFPDTITNWLYEMPLTSV